MASKSKHVNPTLVFTGPELAALVKNTWGKPQRATLVAAWHECRIVLIDPTVSQLAALAGISIAYAYAGVKLPSAERARVSAGYRPLIEGKAETANTVNGHGNGHLPNPADAIGEVIKMFGPELVAEVAMNALPSATVEAEPETKVKAKGNGRTAAVLAALVAETNANAAESVL
jgi:hypothetical protein